MQRLRACVLPLAVASSSAYAGPDWLELGDAGSFISTAQAVVGVGTPQRIGGTLSGISSLTLTESPTGGPVVPDYEDMYIISIENVTKFTFTTDSTDFDADLYLFNITLANDAFGLIANQSQTPFTDVARLVANSTDGSNAAVLNPGIYAVAITGAGRVPTSIGGAIFQFSSAAEISGADGPGGLNPHNGWSGIGQVGSYEVILEGAGYVDVPSPATLALAGLFPLLARRRRPVPNN